MTHANDNMKFAVVFCFVVLSRTVAGRGLLFKHMAKNGDTEYNWDDGLTVNVEIKTAEKYPVFGQGYKKVYVSMFGYLTFDAPQTSGEPLDYYPIQNPVMVAPYWGEVVLYNVNRSHIWYREETKDATQLTKAKDIITSHFGSCGGPEFNPTGLIIVTWTRVTSSCDFWVPYDLENEDVYYFCGYGFKKRDAVKRNYRDLTSGRVKMVNKHRRTESSHGVESRIVNLPYYAAQNSFQVVIATDGKKTYAIFNMHTLEWECCYAWNVTLLRAADGAYYRHPDATSDGLVHDSNVGKDGRWVYEISGKHVIGPDCNQLGS